MIFFCPQSCRDQGFKTHLCSKHLQVKLCLKGVNKVVPKGADNFRCRCRCQAGLMLRVTILSVVFLIASLSVSAQVNVTTYGYNNQRTNVNGSESILTPSNVNSTKFGKLFSQL